MNGRACSKAVGVLALTSAILGAVSAYAQPTYRPTPEPFVTADGERWYLEGRPITYAGHFYYPTGPQVFFNKYEMVRSGDFEGIPIYVRPATDPLSLVFVPISGGRMHPYERPRTGELAGTEGSVAPSFPGAVPSEATTYGGDAGLTGDVRQAAALGTMRSPLPDYPVVQRPEDAQPPTSPVATAGNIPTRPIVVAPLASARRPQGLNGVFIEFENQRWFSSGEPVTLDPARFTRIGDYRGFPVYRQNGDPASIYVVVAAETPSLLAPYSMRR